MPVYRGKKPSNAAVALKYNPEKDYTPIVVATGQGHVAEKIINLANLPPFPYGVRAFVPMLLSLSIRFLKAS